jgi:hypothetical protein
VFVETQELPTGVDMIVLSDAYVVVAGGVVVACVDDKILRDCRISVVLLIHIGHLVDDQIRNHVVQQNLRMEDASITVFKRCISKISSR